MIRFLVVASLLAAAACDSKRSADDLVGCDGQTYTPAEDSPYVLPYPVGESYRMNLGNCSPSHPFHGPNSNDRYAYDFNTQIGDAITASRPGRVVYIEESGRDGGHPNNLVVVDHGDGTFAQYMHLTLFGAEVEVGDTIERGDLVGRSGNTGLAGYPHLHFVVTEGGWAWPYDPVPVTFSNANPQDGVLQEGRTYRAEAY